MTTQPEPHEYEAGGEIDPAEWDRDDNPAWLGWLILVVFSTVIAGATLYAISGGRI